MRWNEMRWDCGNNFSISNWIELDQKFAYNLLASK